ncbi:hypothetical protein Pelo_16810 [Pelomyxa schiedti]|nr:hypothetical protein Pelo_16810 [Pelomyxa schiedti]
MRFSGVQLPDQLGNVKPSQQPPFSTTFSPDQPHQLLPSPQIQELPQDRANNNAYDQESHPLQESEPNTSQPQSPQHKGRTSHTHSKKANTQPALTGSKSTKVSTPHTSKTAKSPLNTRHKDQPNSNVKYRNTNQQASTTDELMCTKEEDPALDSHSPITAKSTTKKSAKSTTSPREEVTPESTTHTASSSFQQEPAQLDGHNQILDSIDLAGQLAEANLKIDKLKKRNAKLRLFIRDYLSNHVAAKDRKIRVLENRAQFLQAQMAQQQQSH